MRHLVERDMAEGLGVSVGTDAWVPLAVVAAVNPAFGAHVDTAIQAWVVERGYPSELYVDDGADDDRRIEIHPFGMRIHEPTVTVALDAGGTVTTPLWAWDPLPDAPVRAQPGETIAAALARLASDPRREVRRSVASHSQCPTAVLDQLSHDTDADVRAIARGYRRQRSRPSE